MRFKKDDVVKITVGKDKGKTGKIERVLPKADKVIIPGINVYKKHRKARQDTSTPSGIIDIIKPINVAKIAFICPKCKQQTRFGFIVTAKKKVRICRKCQAEV